MARQKLGQHFLADAGWRELIAREIGVSGHAIGGARPLGESACWVEIGAGHGEMTELLAATGAPVLALELDPALLRRLEQLARKFPNLSLVAGDVLAADFAKLRAGRRARIYGNLPYYITSPILHHLFRFADGIDEIHVVVQLEVALRLAARPGTRDFGYLSVLTQYFTRPAIALEIPRQAFEPPPEVGSALVSMKLPGERAALDLRPGFDQQGFLDFVKLGFSQKRKTLANNLKPVAAPERVREALAGLGIDARTRAEQLGVSELAAVYLETRG